MFLISTFFLWIRPTNQPECQFFGVKSKIFTGLKAYSSTKKGKNGNVSKINSVHRGMTTFSRSSYICRRTGTGGCRTLRGNEYATPEGHYFIKFTIMLIHTAMRVIYFIQLQKFSSLMKKCKPSAYVKTLSCMYQPHYISNFTCSFDTNAAMCKNNSIRNTTFGLQSAEC